jgi:hypothetical protein
MIWTELVQIINVIDSSSLERDAGENRFPLFLTPLWLGLLV